MLALVVSVLIQLYYGKVLHRKYRGGLLAGGIVLSLYLASYFDLTNLRKVSNSKYLASDSITHTIDRETHTLPFFFRFVYLYPLHI